MRSNFAPHSSSSGHATAFKAVLVYGLCRKGPYRIRKEKRPSCSFPKGYVCRHGHCSSALLSSLIWFHLHIRSTGPYSNTNITMRYNRDRVHSAKCDVIVRVRGVLCGVFQKTCQSLKFFFTSIGFEFWN